MIIASVRYDEQGFLCVVCSPHLAQSQINAVQQRRHAVRGREHQAVLQFVDAGGERADQLRAVVEIHQEKFILRVRGAEKLHGGLPRLFDLVAPCCRSYRKSRRWRPARLRWRRSTTSCSTPSSKTRKFSRSSPVTRRPYGSVTVTLTSVNSVSVFSGLPFRILCGFRTPCFCGPFWASCARREFAPTTTRRRGRTIANQLTRALSALGKRLRCDRIAHSFKVPPKAEVKKSLALGRVKSSITLPVAHEILL